MDPVAAKETVCLFNERINARDMDGLRELMTDDHVFTDPAGSKVVGKPACIAAWKSFFSAFPDYRNVFQRFAVDGDVVAVLGYSECSDARLAGPAIWTARVFGNRLSAWSVFEDTLELRSRFGLYDG